MDGLLDVTKLQLFLVFAVPGIVALYVRAQFLTGRMPPVAEGVIAYIILSLIYHALAYPIAAPLYSRPSSGWMMAGWFLLLFVGPATLGFLLGLNVRKGWTKKLLSKVHLNTIHPVNSAWDWRFGECEECWVLVVLKNGTRWAGYLGQKSFMSSDPVERDIYIQQVYEIGEENKWTPRTSGVWIAHGEIQTLEFWPVT